MGAALQPNLYASEESVKTLEQAREERLDREIDKMISERIAKKTNLAAPITPTAKIKLRGILKKYAKSPHPFQACVKDNMKRFGPGRTEAVCATLKDTIKGNKDWRKGSNTAESDLVIDADVLLALDAISEIDLSEIFLEVRALEEHGTTEASTLLNVKGEAELQRWGIGQVALAEAEKSA